MFINDLYIYHTKKLLIDLDAELRKPISIQINNIQKKYNSKGVIYMLEGGYDPENIDEASRAIIEELMAF